MLVEFLNRPTLKTLDLFLDNPAQGMTIGEIVKEGNYSMKERGQVGTILSKLEMHEMIKVENQDADVNDFIYICNMKSKLTVGLMNIDIELVQRDLDFKKSIRAKAYTYQPRSAIQQTQRSEQETEKDPLTEQKTEEQKPEEQKPEEQKSEEQKPVEGSV